MADRSRDPTQLEAAPNIDRRISIPPRRAAGLVVIGLVPLLALAGLFGERWNRTATTAGALSVQVEYPSRYRYKMLNSITATVTNRSSDPIDSVTVRLDSAYAMRFSTVVFTPPAREAYATSLVQLAPGMPRLVVIELQGERYGRHEGRLHFESTTGDTLAVPVHTLIFP